MPRHGTRPPLLPRALWQSMQRDLNRPLSAEQLARLARQAAEEKKRLKQLQALDAAVITGFATVAALDRLLNAEA